MEEGKAGGAAGWIGAGLATLAVAACALSPSCSSNAYATIGRPLDSFTYCGPAKEGFGDEVTMVVERNTDRSWWVTTYEGHPIVLPRY